MPVRQLVYRCLIISPGDVDEARDTIEDSINRWNAHAGIGLDTRVEGVRWETHSRPEMGGRPQAILNRQLLEKCDFGVAVFWSRLGTPTGTHESGSVEEIDRLLQKGARVMVYFSEADIPQAMLRSAQYEKLQEVKDRYRQQGLYASFRDTSELGAIFPLHLTSLVTELLLKDRAGGQPIPSSGTVTSPAPDIRVLVHAKQVISARRAQDVIAIDVQNHSPADFFLSSVSIETDGPKALFLAKDIFGQQQVPCRIEPGNSHEIHLDAEEVVEASKGSRLICAVAVDKINRHFRSAPGVLEQALKEALAER